MEATERAQVNVVHVSKHYGEHDVQALKDVSLDIQRGSFVALMGPSGCGKTTLLNCIGGLDKPTRGQIFVDGEDIATLSEARLTEVRRDKIGFIFQFFNLLSTLTVRENVELPLQLSGKLNAAETRKRADELLHYVGVYERANFYPAQLSGGEMQRAAVARAVIHQPHVILADEPTGNLDTDNGKRILDLLKSLCTEKGETILIATHSAEAAGYADRVVCVKDGKIVEECKA
jgi:ABC-type lipoprotein export system ATPase subunit